VSRTVISRLLHAHNHSLHVNVKDVEGAAPPDRDTQFRYIQEQRAQHLAGHPCASVDTKKKELNQALGTVSQWVQHLAQAIGFRSNQEEMRRAPDERVRASAQPLMDFGAAQFLGCDRAMQSDQLLLVHLGIKTAWV
jgi:hypothetical protein